MNEDDLVRFGILGDPVIHLVEGAFPHVTLCGVVTKRGKAWVTPHVADCMTCLVRANRPTLEDRISAALRLPKKLLFRDLIKDDDVDDR